MRHTPSRPVPPPRTLKTGQQIPLAGLWEALPQSHRDRTLLTLSRVVAQQLPRPPAGKEVAHDRL